MPHHHRHYPAAVPHASVEPADRPAIILHGRRLSLSATEARLLACFLEQQGQVISLEALSRKAYGRAWEQTLTNRLCHHMSRIRSIIAPHGLSLYPAQYQGYILMAEEPWV